MMMNIKKEEAICSAPGLVGLGVIAFDLHPTDLGSILAN